MQGSLIKPNFIGKFLGNIIQLEVKAQCLTITYSDHNSASFYFSNFTDIPQLKLGFFGCSLTIKTSTESYTFPLLRKINLDLAFKYIEDQVVEKISSLIIQTNELLIQKSQLEYLRDSSIESIESMANPILDTYVNSKYVWQEKLYQNAVKILDKWDICFPLSNGKHDLRTQYEDKRLKSRAGFFDEIESNPLTKSQRLSVVRNNDLNLVLAAAGTGKTSVIVSKALDLIESGVAMSSDILILAYNNAAAKELKERVQSRGTSCLIADEHMPFVSTFHALGRKILKDSNIPTYLSDFCDDQNKLNMWVTKWLTTYVTSSSESIHRFIKLSYLPINPFEFKTKSEYDAYVRDNEYRTLQGERVKGYQELLIANWLFLNGVDYIYEAPYVTKRRLDVGFDYKPDFHIKNTNIYIEHFGIDRKGNTREDIDKLNYNEGIRKKRELHKQLGTELLETFHYDWVENNLENRLYELMGDCEVKLSPKSPDEIFDVLKEMGFIDESAKRYLKCLQAIRVERLERSNILERLVNNKIPNHEEYSELLCSLHTSYVDELERQNRIDFDDMIIRSANAITSKQFKPTWKHVLVDEFQDISMSRMDFLKSLISYGPNPILTVVGDDWQSIYRFSGGKLELTTRFADLVGAHTVTKLDKTFRYNNSIADTAGTFIMKNPEQYEKQITTHTKVDSPQVYLLDSLVGNNNDLAKRTLQIVKTIASNDESGTIAVLARYRYLIEQAKLSLKGHFPNIKIKYWTFHGSKGLEADYCILIGFFQGKTGFPNLNKEEAVVEALLPSLDTFPHSEERRLLYVALTRARKKSYLIADPMAPSEFINELLSPKYKLNIVSKTFEEKFRKVFKCPLCTDGYFKLVSGKFGDFYSCTSGSICASKPRICEKCGSPSIDTMTKSICNNQDCREEKIICNLCGRPMKLREGKFGKFYGCSGYGIKDDQCKNTRK